MPISSAAHGWQNSRRADIRIADRDNRQGRQAGLGGAGAEGGFRADLFGWEARCRSAFCLHEDHRARSRNELRIELLLRPVQSPEAMASWHSESCSAHLGDTHRVDGSKRFIAAVKDTEATVGYIAKNPAPSL